MVYGQFEYLNVACAVVYFPQHEFGVSIFDRSVVDPVSLSNDVHHSDDLHLREDTTNTTATVASTALLVFIGTTKALPVGLVSCLQNIKSSSNSSLTTPSSSAYNTDRYGYNLIFEFKPTAIYHPATNEDTAAAVQCAAAFNVPIAPRSGGHSFEGYCEGGKDGALVIDVKNFQQFSLDPATGIATIGAGTRLGPMNSRLWNAGGYVLPTGVCPSVGVGGHALGGGVGMLARKYGMLTHNIVGVTLIDAKGTIQKVSATSNPDLFWALRGAGGGNFGVVTEFQFQAHKAPTTITTMIYKYPLAQFPAVMTAFVALGQNVTEDLTAFMFPGSTGIDLKVNFLGPKDAALSAIDPLLKMTGPPAAIDIREGNWYQAATLWDWLRGGDLENYIPNNNRYIRGRSLTYRKPLTQKEAKIVVKYLSHPPKGGSSNYFIIDMLGGKIDRPDAPSVFDFHKNALFTMVPFSEWGNPDSSPGLTCAECLKWSADLAKELQGAYSSGPKLEAYQNMMELGMPLSAYYGEENMPRLQQVKKTLDPTNIFSFPQSIPLP
ncbi:hypothetical protein EC991_011385 [Linnemannia zychae]|nr:hypothetical protein EC991_011385 [Linnemannia zychae]